MPPLTRTRPLNWITPTPTAPSLNLQAWSGHLAHQPYPNPARCFCLPAVWERLRYALRAGYTGLDRQINLLNPTELGLQISRLCCEISYANWTRGGASLRLPRHREARPIR